MCVMTADAAASCRCQHNGRWW